MTYAYRWIFFPRIVSVSARASKSPWESLGVAMVELLLVQAIGKMNELSPAECLDVCRNRQLFMGSPPGMHSRYKWKASRSMDLLENASHQQGWHKRRWILTASTMSMTSLAHSSAGGRRFGGRTVSLRCKCQRHWSSLVGRNPDREYINKQ